MLHNTFAGTIKISHLGTFLYEGTERDWEILGNTEQENIAFTSKNGRLVEIKITSINGILGKLPNGEDRYEVGCGKNLEEALDKARFGAIFRYAKLSLEARGWKKQ